jgi:hypothetical protein
MDVEINDVDASISILAVSRTWRMMRAANTLCITRWNLKGKKFRENVEQEGLDEIRVKNRHVCRLKGICIRKD